MKKLTIVCFLTVAFLVLWVHASSAQSAKKPEKATEIVVWRYETLLMDGALLSAEGWGKAAALFQRSVPYPADGPITIMWTPRYVGEDWVRGEKAQVESKWIDYYGTVDASLQYHPADSSCATIFEYELAYTDTRIKVDRAGTARQLKVPMAWRIASPARRAGTIEQVIAYLEIRSNATRNAELKRNAARSIALLQKLVRELKKGRGASAC